MTAETPAIAVWARDRFDRTVIEFQGQPYVAVLSPAIEGFDQGNLAARRIRIDPDVLISTDAQLHELHTQETMLGDDRNLPRGTNITVDALYDALHQRAAHAATTLAADVLNILIKQAVVTTTRDSLSKLHWYEDPEIRDNDGVVAGADLYRGHQPVSIDIQMSPPEYVPSAALKAALAYYVEQVSAPLDQEGAYDFRRGSITGIRETIITMVCAESARDAVWARDWFHHWYHANANQTMV